MPHLEIRVPKLGMDTTEAVVGSWLVNEGDPVSVGMPLVELESEKVNFSVEAEAAGTLASILQPEGSTVAIGGVLATLEIE